MKLKVTYILLLIILKSALYAQDNQSYLRNLNMKNASFPDFVELVKNQTGVNIYFIESWTENLTINLEADSIPVTDALDQILRRSKLKYDYLNQYGYFLLPKNKLQKNAFLHTNTDLISEGSATEYHTAQSRYLSGTKPAQIMSTIEVGSGNKSGIVRIMGKVIDLESGEPIIGATMVVLENGKGAITDENGLVIMMLETGDYTVQFNFIGKEQIKRKIKIHSGGTFNIAMNSSIIAIDEVQIEAKQYRKINSTDVGVVRLSMKSLKQLPVFMGEKDVIKIAKLLPGITSAGEASSGVNVRGGNIDQNLFIINGIPIYNTSHLFGFFSAFNSDLIRDYSIYKGNVPVSYGGRLSSVFNIETRQGNMKKFAARANISPVSAMATIEAPIIKDKASILLSGRSSYSDWILEKMTDPQIRESDALFYDYSASINLNISENNYISVFYYHSYDKFKYGNLSDYNYENNGASLIWKNIVSTALVSKVSLSSSSYSFTHIDTREQSQAYEHSYKLNHNELSAVFDWVPIQNHKFEFGANSILYQLNRGEILPYGEYSLKDPLDLGLEKAIEGSIFLSDNYNITNWLTAYYGLRYSFYTYLGPQDILLYQEGLPKEETSVTGITSYSDNESVSSYSGPEIRTALNIKSGEHTSFKLSFSQMRQYLLMLSNTITISPTDQWKLTDYYIKPPLSKQYSGGFFHIFKNSGISTSIELYYKNAENIVEYKDGANFISTPYTETLVLQGQQKAYGAEFFIEKGKGKLNGWISYTLSKSIIQADNKVTYENINNGLPYPSNYDRPHVLNVVGNYKINRRFTLASNVVYMSGRPVTFPSSLYYIDNIAYIDYSSRNQFRVPDYFRVDVSMNVEGNLKAKKKLHSTWSLNVYNVLGRNNPQSLYFEPGEYFIRGYSFSVIGSPILTLTWNAKLGNYETE